MKIRRGFVSNSSSSSFIIGLSKITAKQLKIIYNHRLCAEPIDWWSIDENEDYVQLYTDMDNFDMYSYLTDVVGVNEEDIKEA